MNNDEYIKMLKDIVYKLSDKNDGLLTVDQYLNKLPKAIGAEHESVFVGDMSKFTGTQIPISTKKINGVIFYYFEFDNIQWANKHYPKGL